jgi:hypothetical protein
MESEVFVKSLLLRSSILVKIDNIPFLVESIMTSIDNDCLSFSIFASSNIKDFAIGKVDEFFVLILEDLPPS